MCRQAVLTIAGVVNLVKHTIMSTWKGFVKDKVHGEVRWASERGCRIPPVEMYNILDRKW